MKEQYKHIKRIILSCKTENHFKSCERMIENFRFNNRIKYPYYSRIFTNKLYRFFELVRHGALV